MQHYLKADLSAFKTDLLEFGQLERGIRDFLMLCLPKSVVKQHRQAVEEMLDWLESGTFEFEKQIYPFHANDLKWALLEMWEKPHFVPASTSDTVKPLRYLKKIMIGLGEKRLQAQQAVGIQVSTAEGETTQQSVESRTVSDANVDAYLEQHEHELRGAVEPKYLEYAKTWGKEVFEDTISAAMRELAAQRIQEEVSV